MYRSGEEFNNNDDDDDDDNKSLARDNVTTLTEEEIFEVIECTRLLLLDMRNDDNDDNGDDVEEASLARDNVTSLMEEEIFEVNECTRLFLLDMRNDGDNGDDVNEAIHSVASVPLEKGMIIVEETITCEPDAAGAEVYQYDEKDINQCRRLLRPITEISDGVVSKEKGGRKRKITVLQDIQILPPKKKINIADSIIIDDIDSDSEMDSIIIIDDSDSDREL